MLTLSQGRHLTPNQIKGVKRFISSAIQGLSPQKVQLISQTGELLEDYSGGDDEGFKKQVQFKNRQQNELETKVTQLLESVMGEGMVIAKANVELDFTKHNVQEETYAPEGTVRSKQSDESIINESSSSGGSKAQSNDLESSSSGSGKKNNEKIVTTTNFEISKKITSTTNSAYATIKRLTVAVTFSDVVLKDVENPKTYMVDIEDLVKDSVGYNKKRGDTVTVKSFKFATATKTEVTSDDGTVPTIKYYLNEFGPYLQYIVIGLLLLMIYKKFTNFTTVTVSQTETVPSSSVSSTSSDEDVSLESDRVDMEKLKSEQAKKREQIQNKVLSQLANTDDLDEETQVRFETLIDQISSDINTNPEAMASMIEILLDKDV